MNFSRHLSNSLYRVIHQTNLEARGEIWTWPQGNSGIKKWTLECHWNTMINIKHSIMPLMAECNASSCCCVLDSLRNGVFYVFFLLLFGLWRPTLSFWRHVVLVWRALKTLNRSLWTLTGQRDFKAKLSAKSLLWKSVFIHIETGTNYHNKNFALRLALKERLKGTRKWPIKFLRFAGELSSTTFH